MPCTPRAIAFLKRPDRLRCGQSCEVRFDAWVKALNFDPARLELIPSAKVAKIRKVTASNRMIGGGKASLSPNIWEVFRLWV